MSDADTIRMLLNDCAAPWPIHDPAHDRRCEVCLVRRRVSGALAALDRLAAKGRAWDRLYDAVVQTDYGLIRTSGVRRDMDAILAEELA